MKSLKSLFALSAVALAVAAPVAQAAVGDVYSSTFQGVTFTFTEVDSHTLTFELAGTKPLAPDWTNANFLAAFDIKDVGLNFNTVTGIANGPGATNLAGLNTQLSASSVDCKANGSPPGSICFDIAPDFQLTNTFDLTYTIVFSSAMFIGDTGPHLQIAFSETQNGPKVGSLYSQNVPQTSSQSTNSTGQIPEPNSSALALLALGLLGGGFWTRRKS